MLATCHSAAITPTKQPIADTDKFLDIINTVFKKLTPGLDYLGDFPSMPAASCQQVVKYRPKARSNFYWIQGKIRPERVYCNMATTQCGGGVWTRIADINMTIPSTVCPERMERVVSLKRSCRKRADPGSSSSVFSTFGVTYHKVCGKIIGY